ncbi:vanadium-dependent haloperoxidase [Flavisolibacter sp. BT320]|nr:vanadium-dependent haloperoxidase [Flavisolibacter longurius]
MKLHFSRSKVLANMLLAFVLFGAFYSCKKADQLADATTDTAGTAANRNKMSRHNESAEVVYQWYNYMAELQRLMTPQPSPLVQSRNFGYIGVGLYEAVQPGIKGGSSFSPKLYQMPAMPKPDRSKDYLWSASANAALASLFKLFSAGLGPVDKASIDAKEASIRSQLLAMAQEAVIQRSEAFGRSVATAIYNWSTTDNFSTASTSYTPVNEPWAWVPTPPNFPAPVGADLQFSRPFLKYTLTALAPPIPVPYSENMSSAFYKANLEVYNLGGATSVTDANKATAYWWADFGGPNLGVPPPYHLLSIVTSVLESQHAGLWKAAEVYAKTGIGLKDGPIITFRSKYHYNLLRPITYIQRFIDPNWQSLLVSPPYPDYTSGIMGLYGPVVEVLINEFGDIPVTDDTYSWRGLPDRTFNSLSTLRKEVAYSRIYAGIHYRFTQDVSIAIGIKLGDEIDKVRVVGPEYQ